MEKSHSSSFPQNSTHDNGGDNNVRDGCEHRVHPFSGFLTVGTLSTLHIIDINFADIFITNLFKKENTI